MFISAKEDPSNWKDFMVLGQSGQFYGGSEP